MHPEFSEYSGDTMELTIGPQYRVFRWSGEGKVLFSVAKRGRAAVCHFSSDKAGLKSVKVACEKFIRFCLAQDWCDMIMTSTVKPSIKRLLAKIGFEPLIEDVYVWAQ